MAERPIGAITGYHAHVYYDAASKQTAATLRDALERTFVIHMGDTHMGDIRMGRWHDRPVGPHPCWSYQIAFAPALFGEIVPWLALNRAGLVVFVHPVTGNDLADHRDFALWMGERLDLDLEALK
jgi:DOPA 4,5-dioxygenase